jgi:hypothetical protein
LIDARQIVAKHRNSEASLSPGEEWTLGAVLEHIVWLGSNSPHALSDTKWWPFTLCCQDCIVRQQCGGLYIPEAIDCLRHCCNKPDRCTYLCPHNKNFLRIWRDTNGIDITIDELRQTTARPPAYVPLIQHRSNRVRPLNVTDEGHRELHILLKETAPARARSDYSSQR